MGSDYLTNPLVFLISTIFDLYIIAVLLRFLLGLVRADFFNPLSQFLVKITNPTLVPLRRVLPAWRRVDTAAIVLLLLLAVLKLFLTMMLRGYGLAVDALLLYALADLIGLVINVFFFTILIQVILSWVAPQTHNPALVLLYQINEPLLGPARRLIPPMGGFDFSPIVVIIGLQLMKMLLLPPLHQLAR